jgi:hypothetical protein
MLNPCVNAAGINRRCRATSIDCCLDYAHGEHAVKDTNLICMLQTRQEARRGSAELQADL